MQITFFGAARVVTGSCYLLEHDGNRFLVDCGMFQGSKELKEHNYGEFPFAPNSIDFVLLTHAHIDHSGLLPKLYKHGYKGITWATVGTCDLCSALLEDCGHIQEMEVERKNEKKRRLCEPLLEPIYKVEDAVACHKYFKGVNYEEKIQLAPGIMVVFHDAGHIMGSAILEITYQENGAEKVLVFSGDLGRYEHYLVNDPTPVAKADTLIIESTYGKRCHENEEDNSTELADIINETFAAGGNVIIPAFAVDRTQDILMSLNELMEDGKIAKGSVYVDSPLAVKATEIFCQHPEYFDEKTTALYKKTGICPLKTDNIKLSITTEESIALNNIKKGALIISASGMADAGRIKHHLKNNIWRPECAVVLVGYQAMGTLGRRLQDGEKQVRIHGEGVNVKAKIATLAGFSAHADINELLTWLGKFEKMPQTVFVTHGEEGASLAFAETISQKFGVETRVPFIGEVAKLEDHLTIDISKAKPVQTEDVARLVWDIGLMVQDLARASSADKLKQLKKQLEELVK